MGTCLSAPLPAEGAADCRAYISERAPPSATCGAGDAAPRCPDPLAHPQQPPGAPQRRSLQQDAPLGALLQVQGLQNALASVSEAPGLGLAEAAELLLAELNVQLVAIYAFCPPSNREPEAAVLLAACGAGADALERRPVVTDPWWSCLQLKARREDSLYGCTQSSAALPPDWQTLAKQAGMRAFRAVPIGPAAEPCGVLMLASEERDSLQGSWWRVWPGVAAVALVHHVRHWQSAATCRLLRRASLAGDRTTFISLLLQGVRTFMDRAVNSHTGVRLAVLDGQRSKALVFELSEAIACGPSNLGPHDDSLGLSGSGRGAEASLVASEMALDNTLLASAMAMGKARFVRDCTGYMQSSASPARDIFTQPAQLVSSLVVVPFVHDGAQPLAALYLTLETPNDFSSVQGPLLGLTNSILPLLHTQLDGHIDDIWRDAHAVRSRSTRLRNASRRALARDGEAGAVVGASVGAGAVSLRKGLLQAASGGAAASEGHWSESAAAGSYEPAGSSCSGDENDDPESDAGSPPTSQLATYNSKRLCTEAMVKALEQELLKCKRLGVDRTASSNSGGGRPASDSGASCGQPAGRAAPAPPCADLVLHEVIGAGGFGVVWRGTWKNVTAAVKVMYRRSTEHEAMKDAVEMAVLSAATHPNIVQVFRCLTDMVEVTGVPAAKSYGDLPAANAARAKMAQSVTTLLPRIKGHNFRPLQPFEDPEEVETCNIIVMEYCDKGSLRENLRMGVFHRSLGGGGSCGGKASLAVDLPALLSVALSVAEAVAYLHSIRLCHCDVKLDNVLLKSSPAQPRGYLIKLADFGLVKVLGAADAVVNVCGAGTVSHLAPELFVPGSRITTAADVFSFGVLLFELYMGGAHAYAGLRKSAIIERVSQAGMRPRFPPSAPAAYVQLAHACWAEAPEQRPHFDVIISSLQSMLERVTRPRGAAAGREDDTAMAMAPRPRA